MDDAKRLSEFFHSAKVSVVAITIDSNRNIELDFVVSIVRLALPNIPWDTGPSQHDPGE
jgi:hypothetical protein